MRPTFLAPRCRGLPQAPLRPPPFARLPPVRATLPRRYADPRSASLRSGDGRPRFGHSPAAGAAWRGLRRGLAIPRPAVTPSASTAGLRVELARWRSLARGPVPCGQSGPREDRRGSSRRSAALFRPAGFGWGRARLNFCEILFSTVPAISLHLGQPPRGRFPMSSSHPGNYLSDRCASHRWRFHRELEGWLQCPSAPDIRT